MRLKMRRSGRWLALISSRGLEVWIAAGFFNGAAVVIASVSPPRIPLESRLGHSVEFSVVCHHRPSMLCTKQQYGGFAHHCPAQPPPLRCPTSRSINPLSSPTTYVLHKPAARTSLDSNRRGTNPACGFVFVYIQCAHSVVILYDDDDDDVVRPSN